MTKWKIILIGNLMVNFPVTLLIIITTLILTKFFDLDWNITLIIGVIFGWTVWGMLIKIWVKYCLKNGISKDEIFKMGKLGLINFQRHRVFDVEHNR